MTEYPAVSDWERREFYVQSVTESYCLQSDSLENEQLGCVARAASYYMCPTVEALVQIISIIL